MPRNKLQDLNNHLFEQLERLNDDSLSQDELLKEVERTKAIEKVASSIINNARLVLDAQQFIQDYGMDAEDTSLKMLE